MFPFDAPDNIRKPKVSWFFQRDQKGTLGRSGLSNQDELEALGIRNMEVLSNT